MMLRSAGTVGARKAGRIPYVLGLIFIVMAAGIIASGYFYYRNYEHRFRTEVERQLSAIAELKAADLGNWRRERLGDAAVLFHNDAFAALVRRYIDKPGDAEAQHHLRSWLERVQVGLSYDQVALLDAQGAMLLAAPDTAEPLAPHLAQQDAPQCLRSGKETFLDFYRDQPDGPIRLAVLAPILDKQDANGPLGVLLLRIDPATYLYPHINRWPTPSSTAETLLVRRDGDDALFLNELRFRKDTALSLRTPLTRTESPAAAAALGRAGIVEGLDYRGVPVIAALAAVPDSPWFLVARMDKAEVYAPVRERLWLMVVLVSAVFLAAGAGMALVWRQQSVRFYKEKSEAAEALQSSELQYRRLFEAAKDGILLLDAQTGMVVDVNPFLTELLGIPRERFLAKRVWELGFLKDVIADQADFVELQRKGYVRCEDMPLEAADGRRINVEFVSNVYRVNHHSVILCNIRDITHRKRAEDALRAKSEELEQTNEELTHFTYTVSHDLRSPLVTIKTFLGYLEKDAASQDAQRMGKDLAYIHTAADKMSRMLDELLELSRVGRKMNRSVEVPLQAVVEEALSLVAGRISQRRVEVHVTGEPVLLYGDRPRLVEVFQNLLDNAVKFMGGQPAPHIEIGAEQTGDQTVLFMRDNGTGIDPRHQSKLFGLFEKLDPSSDGAGMGLALVRRVVEVHGGKIWVESAGPGKGATFRFTLANTKRKST